MKIKTRLLLINFGIAALILISAAIILNTIIINVLTAQQKRFLENSNNSFIYSYYEFTQSVEHDFDVIKSGLNSGNLKAAAANKNLDFIFSASSDTAKINILFSTQQVNLKNNDLTLQNFLRENPYAVMIKSAIPGVYYGKIITIGNLNEFAKKINADIAIVWEGIPIQVTNDKNNGRYLVSLINAYNYLKTRNNFEQYSQGTEADDIIAVKFDPSELNKQTLFKFIVFNTLKEGADLRANIRNVALIIGFAGLILSLILSYLFTEKIRKQISDLGITAEKIKNGDFNNRLTVKGKDELTQLSETFNIMLDELQKKQKASLEYSDFITLINQNPSLNEVSEAALKKITSTFNFSIGALYMHDDGKINVASSYGVQREFFNKSNTAYINDIIKTKQAREIFFDKNAPHIETAIVKIEIKYIYLTPIIYNNKVIAVLELGSVEKPGEEAKAFISGIQEQLATGLTNATAFLQLENLVNELKELNEDYQTQNEKIKQQNETLMGLHKKLSEKAGELEIQKQKAEESTRLKSEFIASMSHELRTPMNSILGLTELILQEGGVAPKIIERLQIVLKSSRRLMSLINDILDLSKIESGRMEIHSEDFRLDEMLKDVEAAVLPSISRRAIEYTLIKNTNTKILVNSDRGKITQVLINLLGNAAKFTEKGSIRLLVSREERTLRFEVKDTGIGISNEDQAYIFEEFRQVDGSLARKYSGTGLGLTICKKMAKLLNGDINLESKEGDGSTFRFEVPVHIVEEYSDDVPAAVFSKNENVQPLADTEFIEENGKFVLIVDDDPESLFTLNEMVNAYGCKTIAANSGYECLKIIQDMTPDLILLDIMMPGMDGFQTLAKIRTMEKMKNVPVFAVTAKAMVEEKDIILRHGFDDYISKPVNTAILAFKINKVQQS
jgi:two-component system chemotaxis sensor kinase CheA